MTQRPAIFRPCEAPGIASVEDGVVLLDGPDGIAVSMTPEAARATAESLRKAAELALGKSSSAGCDGMPP
jgi:hypothetical protein